MIEIIKKIMAGKGSVTRVACKIVREQSAGRYVVRDVAGMAFLADSIASYKAGDFVLVKNGEIISETVPFADPQIINV